MVINLSGTSIGLNGVQELMNAVKSGVCTEGLVLIFDYQQSTNPHLYPQNTHRFMDLLDDALRSGKCPKNLTICLGSTYLTQECVDIMVTRFTSMPLENFYNLNAFDTLRNDKIWNLATVRGDLVKWPRSWLPKSPFASHIRRIKAVLADRMLYQRFMYAEHAIASRRMYENEETFERKMLELNYSIFKTLGQRENFLRETLGQKENFFRNEVMTADRYRTSLTDGRPCPVCFTAYNDVDCIRLVLIPCHHLICQSCWVLVQAHAPRDMNCQICRQPVTRFEQTPPVEVDACVPPRLAPCLSGFLGKF